MTEQHCPKCGSREWFPGASCWECGWEAPERAALVTTLAKSCIVTGKNYPECSTCGRDKPPVGRSVPLEMSGGMCGPDCDGYREDPQPGSLWPGERLWPPSATGSPASCWETTMPADKWLGKITHAAIGYGGYQGVQFGLHLTFAGQGTGVSWSMAEWGSRCSGEEGDSRRKWTHADRLKRYGEIMWKADELCAQAKVDSVDKLVGIPVEVECSLGRSIYEGSWRILEEVL